MGVISHQKWQWCAAQDVDRKKSLFIKLYWFFFFSFKVLRNGVMGGKNVPIPPILESFQESINLVFCGLCVSLKIETFLSVYCRWRKGCSAVKTAYWHSLCKNVFDKCRKTFSLQWTSSFAFYFLFKSKTKTHWLVLQRKLTTARYFSQLPDICGHVFIFYFRLVSPL